MWGSEDNSGIMMEIHCTCSLIPHLDIVSLVHCHLVVVSALLLKAGILDGVSVEPQ